MILRIDTTHAIPVYAQIVDQIKRAIASGTVRSGEALPSLRETAINLRINPLTVNKAYKLLEHEGLVETRHGLGSFVATDAGAAAAHYSRQALTRAIDDLLLDAANLGVTPAEVRLLLDERIASLEDNGNDS